MRYITLLAAAYVGGLFRLPEHGVLAATDEEADRLIDREEAVDVTADFLATAGEPFAANEPEAEAAPSPDSIPEPEPAPPAADAPARAGRKTKE